MIMPVVFNPKNGSVTTEFTEIRDTIRAHRVFLSHLTGYYSVPCFLFNNHGVFSVLSVVNTFKVNENYTREDI